MRFLALALLAGGLLPGKSIVLKAARLFDGKSNSVRPGLVIVNGARIEGVGAQAVAHCRGLWMPIRICEASGRTTTGKTGSISSERRGCQQPALPVDYRKHTPGLLLRGMSVQPLVGGVELGEDENQDAHLAYRAVADAGGDDDAHTGVDPDQLVVELHLGARAAVEEEVSLGEALVVVQGGVLGDVGDVHGGGVAVGVVEGAAGGAARAGDAGDFGEVDDLVAAHRIILT